MTTGPRTGSLCGLVVLAAAAAAAAAGTAACAAPDAGSVTQVLASFPTARSSAEGQPGAGRAAAIDGGEGAGRAPGSAAAAASLVPGIPAVVPVPPGAHVTASAVQPRSGRPGLLGVSVTGTSRLSAEALLAYFHRELRRAGFTATDDSLLPEGTTGAAFGRGEPELLLVAVADRGTERSWSIGGTVESDRPAPGR